MKKLTQVFVVSVIISVLFILCGVFAPEQLSNITSSIQSFLQTKFSWFYMFCATGFLVFSIWIIFSPYGKIKLGKDTDEPEYSKLSWFAMLFSAGMGIGLVFWGVAEPLSHFHQPPTGEGETVEAARLAMRYSFFHWGLHPWGIYSILALALAYFKFRKDAPGLISAIFYPLLKEKVNGPIGKAIDVLAIFATVFGVATSLGLGAMQISGGFSVLTQMPNNFWTQLTIIVVVSFLFILSAITGVSRGIKWLSNTNIVLAIFLMLFILFFGPTDFIMGTFTSTIGSYLQNLPSMSLYLAPFEEQTQEWLQGWTVFYWAWWIAWTPFVGSFIARVSKGRTIREFMIGVLIVPTVFCALWFSIFGGTALNYKMKQGVPFYEIMNEQGMEVVLFSLLDQFPLASLLTVIAIILISVFFITSADSATFVLGMQSTNGNLNPPNSVKIIWGALLAASAAILLYSGGLQALQTASIIAAFPFVFVMIGVVVSLMRSFRDEKKRTRVS